MTSSSYLYDPAWQGERARLQALEDLFDPASRTCVERVGIAEGWRCLEVGFGAGGMATWLADRVGESGYVLATDLDPRLLGADARANLEVRRFDLVRDALPEAGTFDLVHARAVLEHIQDRRAALHQLVATVRHGGWVVVEDIDLGDSVMAAAAERYVEPETARALYRTCVEAYQRLFAEDPVRSTRFGAALPGAMRAAGLLDIAAEVRAPIITGGPELSCLGLTFEYLRPQLVGGGFLDECDFVAFIDLMRDAAFQYVPLIMVTVSGRRL